MSAFFFGIRVASSQGVRGNLSGCKMSTGRCSSARLQLHLGTSSTRHSWCAQHFKEQCAHVSAAPHTPGWPVWSAASSEPQTAGYHCAAAASDHHAVARTCCSDCAGRRSAAVRHAVSRPLAQADMPTRVMHLRRRSCRSLPPGVPLPSRARMAVSALASSKVCTRSASPHSQAFMRPHLFNPEGCKVSKVNEKVFSELFRSPDSRNEGGGMKPCNAKHEERIQ